MRIPDRALRLLTAKFVVLLWLSSLASSAVAAEVLDLTRYRGQIVLVDFWASWCEPCRHSFPWLNEMQAKYGPRGLVVIGVNVDRERADAERFLHDVPAAFEVVFDPDGVLAARYDVPGMPSSYLIGPTGEVVRRHVGFRSSAREQREAELKQLLAGENINTH